MYSISLSFEVRNYAAIPSMILFTLITFWHTFVSPFILVLPDIYLLIVSDALLNPWANPKGMATVEEPPPLTIQTFFLCLFNPSPSTSTSFTHVQSFILSFHVQSGLALLCRPSVLFRYSQAFHSSSSWYDQIISWSAFPASPHQSISIFADVKSLINAFIALTVPSCHSICSSQIANFYSTLGCCALLHIYVSDPHVNTGKYYSFGIPLPLWYHSFPSKPLPVLLYHSHLSQPSYLLLSFLR